MTSTRERPAGRPAGLSSARAAAAHCSAKGRSTVSSRSRRGCPGPRPRLVRLYFTAGAWLRPGSLDQFRQRGAVDLLREVQDDFGRPLTSACNLALADGSFRFLCRGGGFRRSSSAGAGLSGTAGFRPPSADGSASLPARPRNLWLRQSSLQWFCLQRPDPPVSWRAFPASPAKASRVPSRLSAAAGTLGGAGSVGFASGLVSSVESGLVAGLSSLGAAAGLSLSSGAEPARGRGLRPGFGSLG